MNKNMQARSAAMSAHAPKQSKEKRRKASAPSQGKDKAQISTAPRFALTPRRLSQLTYVIGFLLLWLFCSWSYGGVFACAEQHSFATFDADQMKHLTDQSLGCLYWGGRILLYVYKSQLAGGFILAAVLTATAWAVNSLLRVPAAYKGLAFLVPAAELAYFMHRGLLLFYRGEPGIIFALPLCLLLVLGVAALVAKLLRGKGKGEPAGTATLCRPWPLLIPVLLFAALHAGATHFNENEIAVARLQNNLEKAEWDTMIDDALSVHRPSRTIAAYYAIALLQTGQLLDRVFELPFDFPEAQRDSLMGIDESGLYIPDATLYAGIPNIAAQVTMEQMVQGGPRINHLKRLALCALLNDERALAEKYFRILESVLFEGAFVEKYRPMLADRKLIEKDETLARITKLYPREDKFSQNYPLPTFLGYNSKLTTGSDASLQTSIATCLYSKDLQNFLVRAAILRTKQALPLCALQAIAIASLKNPTILKHFPEVSQFTVEEVKSFIMDAGPYVDDKKALRRELKKKWLGTYMYYYYCENNEENQVRPTEKSGVN